jgi:hypothetical protein
MDQQDSSEVVSICDITNRSNKHVNTSFENNALGGERQSKWPVLRSPVIGRKFRVLGEVYILSSDSSNFQKILFGLGYHVHETIRHNPGSFCDQRTFIQPIM